MRNQLVLRCLALIVGTTSGWVYANCDSIVNADYASAASTANAAFARDIIESSPECFGGGPTNALAQIHGTLFQQATAVSDVLRQRRAAEGPGPQLALGATGSAAGAAYGGWSLWGSWTTTDFRQRYPTSVSTYITTPGSEAKSEIDIRNLVIGADTALSPALVAGVSVALDRGEGSGGNTDPGFNINAIRSRGYAIAPYVGWQLNRDLALDASAGFGEGQVDVFTTNTVDSERWFAAANLNYSRWLDRWQVNGRASWLHGVEDYDQIYVNRIAIAGTQAKNTIDQAQLAVQSGYWLNGAMPYVELRYSSDVSRDTTQFGAPSNPIGKDAWVWSIGANFFSLGQGLTGGVVFSQEEGRSHQENWSLMANLNIRV